MLRRFIDTLELTFMDGEEYEKSDSNNRYCVSNRYTDEEIAVVTGNPFVLNNWASAQLKIKNPILEEIVFHAYFCSENGYSLDNAYYTEIEKTLHIFFTKIVDDSIVECKCNVNFDEKNRPHRQIAMLDY